MPASVDWGIANLERPKLEIKKTSTEWFWDIIGYASYLCSIVFLISIWSRLPAEVPGHYNAAGEVDRWGSKWELLIFPGIGLFMLLFLQPLERHPEVHNYPERLNASNAREFYLNSRKLINQIKNICLLLFALLSFESVSVALDWGSGFGKLFLPLIVLGTGTPIVIALMRQRNIR